MTSAQPVTREQAEALAYDIYATDSPAVVELLLEALNGDREVDRFRAMRALEWFSPENESPPQVVVREVEPEWLTSLKAAIFGWDRAARAKAAARFGAIVADMGKRAS